jgi:hypothetical protein
LYAYLIFLSLDFFYKQDILKPSKNFMSLYGI